MNLETKPLDVVNTLSNYPFLTPEKKFSFAYFTITKRFPKIITGIIERQVFRNQSIVIELKALLTNPQDINVIKLNHTIEEDPYWKSFYNCYLNQSILQIPFFFGEIYFYRLINEVTQYHINRIDPFGAIKLAEINLNIDFFKQILAHIKNNDLELNDFIQLSLNGNRADLSQLNRPDNQQLHLLVDDSSDLVISLDSNKTIHLILDNAGVELFTDLVLVDYLLSTGKASKVILHVKQMPTFVSDATCQDVEILLKKLKEHSEGDFVESLREKIATGLLVIKDHIFWNTPNHFTSLSKMVFEKISNEDLFITKGDANYRRFFEDKLIPPETPVDDLCTFLPFESFALRTLKSEIQIGLDLEQVKFLNKKEKDWMFCGKYAVIQKLK